jgi:hypothetical protein
MHWTHQVTIMPNRSTLRPPYPQPEPELEADDLFIEPYAASDVPRHL